VFAYSNRNWDDRALVLFNNSYYETSGWIKQSSPAIPQDDGSFLQDTLTEALSIHGENRYFTCFREQRSGLWFIRSSKSLSENGLFAILKGYESQIFMDIHEREDSLAGGLPADSLWAHRWSRLNHYLEGRGVTDLDAAVEDIFLDDLYRPFTALFEPCCIDALREALKTAGAGETLPPDLAEVFRTPVLDFAKAAAEYLDGAGGRYEPFVRPGGDTAPASLDASGQADSGEADSGQEAWAWFSAFLTRFLESAGFKAPAETGPYEPLYILAYGALALLRPILGPQASGGEVKALLVHWRLGRKIREAYQTLGFDGDEALRMVEIMQAVIARTGTIIPVQPRTKGSSAREKGSKAAKTPKTVKTSEVSAPGAEAWAAAFLAANYEAEDFRSLLKVNRFDDVTWFNKEAFEETLYYASLFLLAEDEAVFGQAERQASGSVPAFTVPGNTAQRAAFATELVRLIFEAEEKSGYRMDELIALLSGT
jgi:hypothetical protein